MNNKELREKLKRKNLIIERQQELLDEYRNTINYLTAKLNRLENPNKKFVK